MAIFATTAAGGTMLEVIKTKEIAAFRRTLAAALRGDGAELLRRTLTTPGGPINDALIVWREDLGLWAYFSETPYDGRRWLCCFGLEGGALPAQVLSPAVEINLSGLLRAA